MIQYWQKFCLHSTVAKLSGLKFLSLTLLFSYTHFYIDVVVALSNPSLVFLTCFFLCEVSSFVNPRSQVIPIFPALAIPRLCCNTFFFYVRWYLHKIFWNIIISIKRKLSLSCPEFWSSFSVYLHNIYLHWIFRLCTIKFYLCCICSILKPVLSQQQNNEIKSRTSYYFTVELKAYNTFWCSK